MINLLERTIRDTSGRLIGQKRTVYEWQLGRGVICLRGHIWEVKADRGMMDATLVCDYGAGTIQNKRPVLKEERVY